MALKSNPLKENQVAALEKLVNEITAEQVIWINGYLEGRIAALNGSESEKIEERGENETKSNLTILYGTDTGRSKKVAEQMALKAKELKISTKVENMYDYKVRKIRDEENLAIIVSTHGEGDPPDMAEDFYKFITGKRAPKLPNLNYSVLALGDKSYKYFCKTGVDVDQAISRLGGKAIAPLIKCDVDYEDDAERWINSVIDKLDKAKHPVIKENNITIKTKEYSRKNPFYATVLDKVRITGRGSDKEVYHLELSLEDSGLKYEPGDSIGIVTKNPDTLVNQILIKTGFDAGEKVTLKTGETSLVKALTNDLEITIINRDVIQKFYEKTGNERLKEILDDEEKLDDYLYGNDLLDLLEDFPFDWKPQELADILRLLPPRLYSISSSQESVEDEVHITVSLVQYEKNGRKKVGACSSFLANEIEIDSKIPIYVDKNPAFKLPPNGSKIIMVGAGTGIAPYRAFLQQRESQGIEGNTWLFFGDRRFQSDFLYQMEWQKLLKSNHLEKLDVAFSRDQEKKIYVQHRLKEKGKEVYEWIKNGAYFYLCGDMKNMARDVNKALLDIVQTEGGISEDKAEAYLKQLKREKRFQTDVY